jgi:hypothetical protein
LSLFGWLLKNPALRGSWFSRSIDISDSFSEAPSICCAALELPSGGRIQLGVLHNQVVSCCAVHAFYRE